MNRVCEISLIAAMVVAVAAFGGTETLTWSAVEIVVLLLGVAMLIGPVGTAEGSWRGWIAPAGVFTLAAMQWLMPIEPMASVDRWATSELLVRLLVYGCAFAVARRLGEEQGAAQRMVFALTALGILEAAYGLVQYLTGWQKIFWFEKVYYRESATGTYVNHNHFAGLLEMVIPFAVAQATAAMHRQRAGGNVEQHSARAGLLGIQAAIMLLAVVFSESRMGLIACVISLAAMAAVLGLSKRKRPATGMEIGVILALVALTAALVVWLGVDPVIERFVELPNREGLHTDGGGRIAVWMDTLRLIGKHPVFGVGLGGFEAAYTQVQTVEMGARVDYAHNDYLQTAAELGVLGAVVFWGVIFAVAARTLRMCWGRGEPWQRSVALGATGAVVALLLHSLTDFNLYVPANGLVFAVVMGLGAGSRVRKEM